MTYKTEKTTTKIPTIPVEARHSYLPTNDEVWSDVFLNALTGFCTTSDITTWNYQVLVDKAVNVADAAAKAYKVKFTK
jgi:hypothetical protein